MNVCPLTHGVGATAQRRVELSPLDFCLRKHLKPLKADSHIACRAHAVPLPCRAAKGLECVFPI